ncbi:MAG: cadherin-like beta sandwich domain-containing protein, partial [Clostridiales bacterium]|nr:cadherin-like beta sandwich domain-containing protein [Clostridiales bacterium]
IIVKFAVESGDLGTVYGDYDKSIADVEFSAGELSPNFSSDTYEYTLTVPANVPSIKVRPTAHNICYMVQTTLGETEENGGKVYKRTYPIPVKAGDKITVECGNPKFPVNVVNDDSPDDWKIYTFNIAIGAAAEEEPVNKEKLNKAIAAANISKESVAVSSDGKDIPPSEQWVTAEDKSSYAAAIAAAQTVADDEAADQAAVDGAVTTLANATVAFNSAKKAGTRVPPNKTALNAAIADANINKESVAVSLDGKDIPPSEQWVTAEDKSSYAAVIAAAQVVADDEGADQAAVDGSVTTLANATAAFNSAKKAGTRVPPDKTALKTAITDARKNIWSVTVSTDGSDVFSLKQWVTEEDKSSYLAAIAAAQAVVDDEAAGRTEVDGAVETLANATETFNLARKYGKVQANYVALDAAIARIYDLASNTYVEGYHKENDRYNGKASETIADRKGSFWKSAEALVEAALSAKAANSYATQEAIDKASEDLNEAIDKLIPANQVNATELYEAVKGDYRWRVITAHEEEAIVVPPGSTTNLKKVTAETTTESSLAAFQTAIDAGQAELDKLFASDGNATEYNSSTGDAVKNVEDTLVKLEAAIANLDMIAHEWWVNDASIAYDGLDALANKIFNPVAMNSAAYTEESWNSFIATRNDALEFYKTHSVPVEGIGKKEVREYVGAYSALWDACYEGLTSKESVTATLHIVDKLSLRHGLKPSEHAGIYTVELPAENTLGYALKAALGDSLNLDENPSVEYNLHMLLRNKNKSPVIHDGIGVFVNGIYIFNMGEGNMGGGTVQSRSYTNIRLKDGDTVVVAMMDIPTYTNVGGATITYIAFEALGDVQYLETMVGKKAVTNLDAVAGESIDLKVMSHFALPYGYNRGRIGLSDVSIYMSDCCATKEEALKAKLSRDTGIVSGADGKFSLMLYSADGSNEAWYTFGTVLKNERGGLANGPIVLVHVKDPSDLSAIRSNLKSELEEVYTAYDDDFYTEAQKTELEGIYREGLEGIENATNSGAINATANAAISAMRDIQTGNDKALSSALANIHLL